MELLELIVCTECKTRVEYHDESDGYMSCECWIRGSQDEDMPSKWVEIEDCKANPCGTCKRDISERSIFRCADCGLPFHRECLDYHCKHGNQPQELRAENLFIKEELRASLSAAEAAIPKWVSVEEKMPPEGVTGEVNNGLHRVSTVGDDGRVRSGIRVGGGGGGEMKISDKFIQECVEERLDSAVKYGVRRAYKHSDKKPPSDDQVEIICESVRSALFEIFECPSPSGA